MTANLYQVHVLQLASDMIVYICKAASASHLSNTATNFRPIGDKVPLYYQTICIVWLSISSSVHIHQPPLLAKCGDYNCHRSVCGATVVQHQSCK